jgi:hypothetical protein
MATNFSGGGSQSTRWEPPTMSKQLVNFITCGCESSAPFFVIYLMKVIPESILSVPGEGYSRIYFKRTWWRLFQNRFWAYLVKVIPESILSVPGEGYSRIDFKRTWWRLFQNWFWAYLVKVIPESILSVPGEGYSRIDFKRTWWRLFQNRF